MIQRDRFQIVLLFGLLAVAVLLTGFSLAPGSNEPFYTSVHPSDLLSTGQIQSISQGEVKISQLVPDATTEETAAMLAVQILLLDKGTYRVALPVLIR